MTEATAVSTQSVGYFDVPGLWTDEQVAGWRRVTDAVHAGGGRIVVQLWHVGRISHVSLLPPGQEPAAPSAIAANAKTYVIADGKGAFHQTSMPRALEQAGVAGVIEECRQAARRAITLAGFDGVEIHGANGYLFDQFLKTSANRRDDDYGGSIENRARLLLDVCRAIGAEIGGGRTGLRISPASPANDVNDDDPQALFAYLMKQLASVGLSDIHVVEDSTGGPRTMPDRPFDYRAMHENYRAAGGAPAWMVSNGYDRPLADAAINDAADLGLRASLHRQCVGHQSWAPYVHLSNRSLTAILYRLLGSVYSREFSCAV